jgi:hypothetical protein
MPESSVDSPILSHWLSILKVDDGGNPVSPPNGGSWNTLPGDSVRAAFGETGQWIRFHTSADPVNGLIRLVPVLPGSKNYPAIDPNPNVEVDPASTESLFIVRFLAPGTYTIRTYVIVPITFSYSQWTFTQGVHAAFPITVTVVPAPGVCQSGTCIMDLCAWNSVQCWAVDDCHVEGLCNPSSGICSTPNAPNRSPCWWSYDEETGEPLAGACVAGSCEQVHNCSEGDVGGIICQS